MPHKTHRKHGHCLLAQQVLLLQARRRCGSSRRVSFGRFYRHVVLHTALLGGGGVSQRLLNIYLDAH
jgi:hypothetical protein